MLERLGRRFVGSVLVWDILITLLCLYSTTFVRVLLGFGKSIGQIQAHIHWQLYFIVVCVWALSFLLLIPQRALFSSSLLEAIGRLLGAVALAALVFAGMLYLSFRDVSRLQFLYFAVIDFVALLCLHLIIRSGLRLQQHSGRVRRVLMVGTGIQAEQLASEFGRHWWLGVQVVGCTADEGSEHSKLVCLGSIDTTVEIVTRHRIDEVIFTLPAAQQERVVALSLELQQYPVMLHMVPGLLDLTFARTPIETFGGVPLISLRESAFTDPQRMLKRLFDAIASGFLLLLLSPIMLCIALLIKLESPGPIFFLQERIGEHGQRFKMIKFRSMYQDAEQRWLEVVQRDANGHIIHKSTKDPRVTAIGRRLRRSSLDELPQLINVLLGQMSLVGPRPEMPYIAAEYQPWQWHRFRVPPGMTGWWQVNGRSDRPMHLHTEDDLYYIHNYSFWLDLKILWMTVRVVVTGRGAF